MPTELTDEEQFEIAYMSTKWAAGKFAESGMDGSEVHACMLRQYIRVMIHVMKKLGGDTAVTVADMLEFEKVIRTLVRDKTMEWLDASERMVDMITTAVDEAKRFEAEGLGDVN